MSRILGYLLLPSLISFWMKPRMQSLSGEWYRRPLNAINEMLNWTGEKIVWKLLGLSMAVFAVIRLMMRLELVLDVEMAPLMMNLIYSALLLGGILLIVTSLEGKPKSGEKSSRELNAQVQGTALLSEFISSFVKGFQEQRSSITKIELDRDVPHGWLASESQAERLYH